MPKLIYFLLFPGHYLLFAVVVVSFEIQKARLDVGVSQTCQLPTGGFPLRRFSCWYDIATDVRVGSSTRLGWLLQRSFSSSSSWLRCNLCKWCSELEERLRSRISLQIRSSWSTAPMDRPGEQHGDATTWTEPLTDGGGGGGKMLGRYWTPRMGVVGPVTGELGCGLGCCRSMLGWISQDGPARPLTVDISVAHVDDRPVEAKQMGD